MRQFLSALVALSFLTSLAPAQDAAMELDAALRGWEKATSELKTFIANAERITRDQPLQLTDTSKGFFIYSKGENKDDGSKVRLDLNRVDKKDFSEKFLLNGQDLHEYLHDKKIVRITRLAPNQVKACQNDSLSLLLLGLDAEKRNRFHVHHIESNPPDKFYHYLRFVPKKDQDKAEFVEARISLLRTNFLPAQIWLRQSNGTEIIWTFQQVQINKTVPAKVLEPVVPAGWQVQRIQPFAPK